MNILNFFGFGAKTDAKPNHKIKAMAGETANGGTVYDAMMNLGNRKSISVEEALENTAVMRSVELISRGIGMLPLYIMKDDAGKKRPAKEHFLYDLLTIRPNNWQTASQFKTLMQFRALLNGEAHALKIKSGSRIIALQPLDGVKVEQQADWTIKYKVRGKNGGEVSYSSDEIFTIKGLSIDGITGLSKVKAARDVLELAAAAQEAAEALFSSGLSAGGALEHPAKLSPEAVAQLKADMDEKYSGPENTGKWMVLQEGLKAQQFSQSSVDSQHLEMRKHQTEEIARVFGVPRPLLSMDETAWGTGIEQLSLLFIQFTLLPWFNAWEEAVANSLLTDIDRKNGFFADFDERELLRGSLKDQAEYFSKALGGQKGWMSQNDVRDLTGLGAKSEQGADSITPAIAIGATSNVAK